MYLNNLLNPSAEVSTAAEQLGIDFSASALQSKGFSGVLDDVKEAMLKAAPEYINLSEKIETNKIKLQELTEQGRSNTEEYKNLTTETQNMQAEMDALAQVSDSPISKFAALFGTTKQLNSMLSFTSESGSKSFQDALSKIKSSAGETQKAFDQMDSSPLGKMESDFNKLKIAGMHAGEALLPIATELVEGIGKLAESFSKLEPEEQKLIAAAGGIVAVSGPVLDSVGSLTTGIGSLIQFLGSPVGIGVGVAAAIVGVGIAIEEANEKAEQAALEERFGDISLSLEETKDIAEELVNSEALDNISQSLEAFGDLKQQRTQIEGFAESLEKSLMKAVTLGGLDETSSQELGETLESYVNNGLGFLEQTQFSAKLSLKAMFPEGDNDPFGSFISDALTQSMSQIQGEFDTASDEVGKAYAEAMTDGIINAEEAETIAAAIQKMQNIMDKVSEALFESKINKIKLGVDLGSLDAESFLNLMDQMNDAMQEKVDAIDEWQIQTGTIINLIPDLPEEAIDNFNKVLNNEANRQKYEVELKSIDVSMGVIEEKFGDAAKQVADNISTEFGKNSLLSESLSTVLFNAKAFKSASDDQLGVMTSSLDTSVSNLMSSVEGSMVRIQSQLSQTDMPKLDEIMQTMLPTEEALFEMKEKLIETGKGIPESLRKGISDVEKYKALAGDTQALYFYIGEQLSENNPNLEESLMNIKGFGEKIPASIMEGIENQAGLVYDSTSNVYKKIQEAQGSDFVQELIDELNASGEKIPKDISAGMLSGLGIVYDSTTSLWTMIGQAASDNYEPTSEQLKGQAGVMVDDFAGTVDTKLNEIDFTEKGRNEMSGVVNGGAQAMDEGNDILVESTQNMADAVTGTLDEAKLPEYTYESSAEMMNGLITGVDEKLPGFQMLIQNIIDTLSTLNSENFPTYDWGADLISNFADGIRSGTTEVERAALRVAEIVSRYLHHSTPDIGPMSDDDTWMPDMMNNFAMGIKNNRKQVLDESFALTKEMERIFKDPIGRDISFTDFASRIEPEEPTHPAEQKLNIDYSKLVQAISEEVGKATFKVEDKREQHFILDINGQAVEVVGRAVTPVVSRIQAMNMHG